MSRHISSALATIAMCLVTATPVSSQENQSTDWERAVSADAKVVAATARFDNGITLIVRCQNREAFDVIITGLPESTGTRRLLQVGVGEGAKMRDVSWLTTSNRRGAFSLVPMTLARDLMRGGTIRIRMPAPNGQPSTLYVMETEPSGSAIAEILTECGRPLEDPRDNRVAETLEELPVDLEWVRRPVPPANALLRVVTHRETYVNVSCLTAEAGKLKDCRIESAHPFNSAINRLILEAARNGRLQVKGSRTPPPVDREISYGLPIRIS